MLEGTPFRTPALLEPLRLARAMLMLSAISLSIASYGTSIALSVCLLVASRMLRVHPSTHRAMAWVLAGMVPYVSIAMGEGLLLSNHAVGDAWGDASWRLTGLAHSITMLAGFPGLAIALGCALAVWRVRIAHREPSLDAASSVILSVGCGLAVGGTVAAFIHLTFKSIPATLLLVGSGVALLVVVVVREIGSALWLRRVFRNGDSSWRIVPADGDAPSGLLPLTRQRRDVLHGVLRKRVAGGGYRDGEGPVVLARCSLDARAAMDPGWRRCMWAVFVLLFVGSVAAGIVAVPEMLRFLR